MTRRRVLLGLLAVVLLAVAWTGWKAFQLQRDLTSAEDAATRLRETISGGDEGARRAALGDLRVSAAAARDHADGWWWGLLSHLPLVGDDVDGLQALSRSIDTVASDGIQPLADVSDQLDGVASGGRVDLERVASLQQPIERAAAAFGRARDDVDAVDSSGFVGALRTRFDDYVEQVDDLAEGSASATTAAEVLPAVLGADGPKRYLLAFQNNAEIRATGGLPGSWAVLEAEDGAVAIERQGTGGQFISPEPVLPLSAEEQAVYSDLLGIYFVDAGFTPDFPRAAELMAAHHAQVFPNAPLDGVMALDPVALSYLLAGTGPVTVDGVELTPDNAVEQLLSEPYLTRDNAGQDAFFAEAARSIFGSATSDLASPLDFVRGLVRAKDEGRFLFESTDDAVAPAIADSTIRGALATDDGERPHVEVALNDQTGSKMSYYLRYRTRVVSQSCEAGVQQLQGQLTLDQAISAAEAATLPESVTGPGTFGTEKGLQTVSVRLYSPTGGDIGQISIDGQMVQAAPQPLDGREVSSILVQLDGSDDVVVNWAMTAGVDQTGPGTVGVTPSVVAGAKDSSFASSC